MKKHTRSIILTLCSAGFLSGCLTAFPEMREETARRVAMPVFMYPRTIDSEPFQLRAFERVHKEGQVAQLYIAGGNTPWDAETISFDPTPQNPVALRIASKDGSPNVIYLGQPCQYLKTFEGTKCDKKYWTTHNFSPEVLTAYNSAIDDIKRRYQIPEFHIIGHDTGGTIASLIAADRADILSLRTVSGILDLETYANRKEFTLPEASANPASLTEKLQYVPQRHFIGREDFALLSAVHHSYDLKTPDKNCLSVTFVDQAEHDDGWQSRWPNMLKQSVECQKPVEKAAEFTPAPQEFHDAKK